MLDLIVNVFLFLIGCVVGPFFGIFSLWKLYEQNFLKNSFGLICAADVTIQMSFSLIYSLSTVMALKSYVSISSFLGIFPFILSVTTFSIQILKASNRLCAILLYWKYKTFFSFRNTVIYITLILTFISLLTLPFLHSSCQLYYDTNFYYWFLRHGSSAFCYIFLLINLDSSYVLLPIAVILNVISAGYLYCRKKNVLQQQKLSVIEKRFLFQTFFTSIITTFFLLFFSIIRCSFEFTEFSRFFFTCAGTILYLTLNEATILISLIDLNKLFTRNSGNQSSKLTNITRIQPKIVIIPLTELSS